MRLLLFSLTLLSLYSCTQHKNECSQCEEELRLCQLYAPPIPLDIPEPQKRSTETSNQKIRSIEVSVSKDNEYFFEGEKYDSTDVLQALQSFLAETNYETRSIKIVGNERAEYQYVFRLLNFCQVYDLDPILAYTEE